MIIGIASGKGGVGKSSIASNLAYYYSQKSKILLLDLDFGLSNLHYFFNIFPTYSLYEHFYKKISWDVLKYSINPNLELIYSGQGEREIADITKDQKKELLTFIKESSKQYDHIIIDLGPGIHSNVIDFLNICSKVAVVINSDRSSVTDGYQLSKLLVNSGSKNVFIIANKITNPDVAFSRFKNINETLKKYTKKKIKFLGNISNSRNFEEAYNSKILFLKKYSKTNIGKQIITIAENLIK